MVAEVHEDYVESSMTPPHTGSLRGDARPRPETHTGTNTHTSYGTRHGDYSVAYDFSNNGRVHTSLDEKPRYVQPHSQT